MDTAYLKENVGDVLSLGLAATVRANAPDPVEYLARWLVKHVNTVEKTAVESKKLATLKAADVVAEESEAKVKVEDAKKVVESKKVIDDREAKLKQYMTDIKGPDGLFEGFVDHLRTCTGASGVYVGRLESPEVMKYIATTDADKFLMEKSLTKGQGVTFDIFEDPEEEEEPPEQYDDDGNVIPVVKKEPEPRTIFVPDLLMGPLADRVHFFRLPRPGCYYSMRLSYSSTLNDESLDQAVEKESRRAERSKRNAERQRRLEDREAKKKAAKTKKQKKQLEDEEDAEADDLKMEEDSEDSEEEREREERERKVKEAEDAAEDGEGDEKKAEEKKEEKVESVEEKEARLKKEADDKKIKEEERLFSKVQKQTVHLALCLDTVGQNRRFTEAEMKLVVQYGKQLLAILVAQDRQLFKDERARRMGLIQFNSGFKNKTDEEKDSVMEEMSQKLTKEGKPVSAADLAFKFRQEQLLSMRGVISEFRTYNVFRGPLSVLQTLFYMLDYTKEEIADPDGKPNWKKIRPKVGDDLFNKIRDYDPRDEQKRSHKERYARVAVLRALMEGHEYEALKAKNFPLAEIFAFVKDALAVKRQAARERRAKKKAEQEAKLKAEEDAAAAAEAKREADELAEEEARVAAEAAAEAKAADEEEGDE